MLEKTRNGCPGDAEVVYRWHPWFGERVGVAQIIARSGCVVARCHDPEKSGAMRDVPVWMLDPVAGRAMLVIPRPVADAKALEQLRVLLASVLPLSDPVVATALLDRLLHHAVVIQIEGASYRLRAHADLIPEHVRAKAPISPPAPPRRRGRLPQAKNGAADHTETG